MREMTEIKMQTPIEIALGIDEDGMTTAKKLFEFLGMDLRNYSRWVRNNITENKFAEENVDYWVFVTSDENPSGGRPTTDYRLTAGFAKKLSMMQKTEKGECARDYFIKVENKAKYLAVNRAKLPQTMQIMYAMMDEQANITLRQQEQEEKIKELQESQKMLTDTFQASRGEEGFQSWANRCLGKIAESPKFDKGYGRNSNYTFARKESYDRLKNKWNCNLSDRVSRAKGRAIERNPGITKTELNSINKLTVISSDKSLRPVYETVLKEMMIAYCVN